MILNDPDQWDRAALSEVIAYRGAPKQVWDNTGIASPLLNDMRNSLNAQVWPYPEGAFSLHDNSIPRCSDAAWSSSPVATQYGRCTICGDGSKNDVSEARPVNTRSVPGR